MTDAELLRDLTRQITWPVEGPNIGNRLKGIADRLEQMEWVSVKERLPEHGQEILIVRGLGERQSVCIEDYLGDKYWGAAFYNVTHWMPRPPTPEVSDERNS